MRGEREGVIGSSREGRETDRERKRESVRNERRVRERE